MLDSIALYAFCVKRQLVAHYPSNATEPPPEVLSAIKRFVDESNQVGQYYLTGSQNFAALRQVSESLAGRVAIVELDPLTIYEEQQLSSHQSWLKCYLQNPELLLSSDLKLLDKDLLTSIWQGGFPGTLGFSEPDFYDFFRSYPHYRTIF